MESPLCPHIARIASRSPDDAKRLLGQSLRANSLSKRQPPKNNSNNLLPMITNIYIISCSKIGVADQKIVSYIRMNLAKGVNAATIRMALARNGYSLQQVEQAFQEASSVHVHHTISFSPTVIGLILAILAGAGGFGYFLFSQSSSPSQLLDVEIGSVTPNLNAGDDAAIVVELTNMGSKNRYDVEVKAELVFVSTGEIVASQTETIALETTSSLSISLAIPSDAQKGSYVLRVIATYDGKRAVASTTLSLGAAQQSCSDGKRNQGEEGIDCGGECAPCQHSQTGSSPGQLTGQCDDFNACTADTFENGACTFAPIVPCCGNGACETGEQPSCSGDCGTRSDAPELSRSEQLERIKLIATSDPSRAASECQKETIPDYKDSCLSNIATTAKDVSYCSSVSSERLKNVCIREVAEVTLNPSLCTGVSREDFRDTCYISFVTEYRDYSVCEQIVNENLRQSCMSLRALSQPASPIVQQPTDNSQETVYESPYI